MMAAPRTLRVSVTDVWDTVPVAVTGQTTIAEIKATALAQATGRRADPGDYSVKYRGALLSDESRTLANLGVPDAAPMIVLPSRRQPVR